MVQKKRSLSVTVRLAKMRRAQLLMAKVRWAEIRFGPKSEIGQSERGLIL